MNPEYKIKRLICPSCGRAEKTCICHFIIGISSLVEVVILQHPLELNQVKGSATLLHLSLCDSQRYVGELFDVAYLSDVLYASGKHPVLLYPDLNDSGLLGENVQSTLSDELLAAPENLRLIVLDGTWRKSRKMLYLNPLLQSLPRLSLKNMPESHYHIRKAHAANQLSTLEASCYALMELENNKEKFSPLLDAFDGFITQQLALCEKHKNKRSSF